MNSIFLQLNTHKKYHNKLFTNTQETNTTSDKYEEKTKSSLIPIQTNNNKKVKNNYYLKRYENYFHKKLVIKYNVLPIEYNQIQLDNFISAKYCHNLATFKEKLIFNEFDEFLKRCYSLFESRIEIPKFSQFYKSYLNFFCFPTFSELRFNELIEEMVEKKAKIFYNEKYNEQNEHKNSKKKNKDIVNTIIFSETIRKDLSKNNDLADLSKVTSIINNISNKESLISINTINQFIDILDNKRNKRNIKLNKNNNLIKDNNKELRTERLKQLDNNNNILKDNTIIVKTGYISERNNKEKIINIKNVEKNNKINNKKNLMNIIKNHHLNNQIKIKKKIINNKLLNNKNKNYNTINDKIEMNNIYYKLKNNNLIKQIISSRKNNKIKDSINNNDGKGNNNIEHDNKHFIPTITKNNKKRKYNKFDSNFQTFLKIALNFNKSPPKKRTTLYNNKVNKNSKISLTDRNDRNISNKPIKLKNKININSYLTGNLSEYIKYNEKTTIKKFSNEKKRLYPISRNYKVGFENIKTTIVKTNLKNKLKEKMNMICFNSSRKQINPYNKYKLIAKNYSKNNTQKLLKTSKETIYFNKRERCHLTTINLSHFYSKDKKKRISNLKTINMKKTLLPLNKLTIKTIGNNNILKRHITSNKIKVPNI